MVKTGQDAELCDDIAEQLILNDPGKKFKVENSDSHFYFASITL